MVFSSKYNRITDSIINILVCIFISRFLINQNVFDDLTNFKNDLGVLPMTSFVLYHILMNIVSIFSKGDKVG